MRLEERLEKNLMLVLSALPAELLWLGAGCSGPDRENGASVNSVQLIPTLLQGNSRRGYFDRQCKTCIIKMCKCLSGCLGHSFTYYSSAVH